MKEYHPNYRVKIGTSAHGWKSSGVGLEGGIQNEKTQ